MSVFDNLISIDNPKNIGNRGIVGITDEFFCVYLYNLLHQQNKDILVVINSLYEANKIYSSLLNYEEEVYLFPMDDFLTSESLAISPDLQITRLETLNAVIKSDKPKIVVTNLMGYLRFLRTKNTYKKNIVTLKLNEDIEFENLIEKIVKMGYMKSSLVNNTKEFAKRGYILDIFPIGFNLPVRIEFFGDTIDSIRTFNPETQKSLENIEEVTIFPSWEFLIDQEINMEETNQKYLKKYSLEVSCLYEYSSFITAFKDYDQIKNSYLKLEEEMLVYRNSRDKDFKDQYMYSFNDINPKENIYYMNLNNLTFKDINVIDYNVSNVPIFNEDKTLIESFLQKSIKDNKTVIICLKKHQINALTKHLNVSFVLTDVNNIYNNKINIIIKSLAKGFSYKNYIFITEKELFKIKRENKKYKTKLKYSSKIKNIEKLEIGDYVVHEVNGIGVYNGLKELSSNGLKKDYIEVLYKDNDKLYIPVENIEVLNKFSGKEGVVPKINKLGGTEWLKTKSRVRSKVKDIAEKLIKLYALRETQKGYAFSKDSSLLKKFEEDVPFELTKDQIVAISQIKKDMESKKPMDRLLCGDVGFGKTEVAFVACFKAILDSKQVLFLCPTTILSNQHYNNALERFKNFPVNIGILNRFTPPSEKRRIVEGLQNGTIDLLFGTHRLLSNDIKPSNLGLLIIDEEQRFGVTHKEKIKEYKNNVDVLTLTATPIPRTLQMSLTGIRSLSLIETPPVNRYPIQTYVIDENDQVIKDAIYKELSRGGQIFMLYNRIESIERKAFDIQKLVPDARIVCAHGRLNKEEIENRMLDFTNQRYDILLCTTIIETGIDIPNVNTLIIFDADRFGLSQLYQIRGRVGRSDRFAYAYLMYKKDKVLTETAVKRLNVIKEFTELGSGFSIATRDLSIRGAGDMLGSEQTGFIDTVGIDLYLKILKEEIAKQKGEEVEEEEEQNSNPFYQVSTHIDDSYIDDNDLKIEIHRMINSINSKKRLEEVKKELEDRFGTLSEEVIIYMYEELFEKQAKKVFVEKVVQTKNYIELYFDIDFSKKVNMEELFVESFKITPMFRFKSTSSKIIIILDTIKLEKDPIYYLVEFVQKIEDIYKKNID